MKLYNSLSRINFLKKSYSGKFLFIAFLGIHIPLIGLIIILLFQHTNSISPGFILTDTLILTTVSCFLTCVVLNKLVQPIRLSNGALSAYFQNKALPKLPTHHNDDMGDLMRDLNSTIYTLDELLKEKRDFIYLLTHDLRNPLNNIIILTDLIKKMPNGIHVPQYIDMIEKISQNQLTLIRTVLSLAESEYRESANLKPFRVIDVIIECSTDLDITAKAKGVQIKIDIPLEHYVKANEPSFKLLINNLLTNAIKFSNYGGDILIQSVLEHDKLMINVIDKGIGLPDNADEELFKAFTKLGRKGTFGEDSTGIGLYFCKKIMQYHNGTITANSQGPGTGTKFTITFPLGVPELIN